MKLIPLDALAAWVRSLPIEDNIEALAALALAIRWLRRNAHGLDNPERARAFQRVLDALDDIAKRLGSMSG